MVFVFFLCSKDSQTSTDNKVTLRITQSSKFTVGTDVMGAWELDPPEFFKGLSNSVQLFD